MRGFLFPKLATFTRQADFPDWQGSRPVFIPFHKGDEMSDYSGVTGDAQADLTTGGDVPDGTVEETTPTPAASAPSLSPAEVQSMIAQALQQADQTWSKRLQSQLDKRDSGLVKRIEASKQQADRVAKSAKAGGLDEAAANALGQQFLNEDIAALLDEANTPQTRNGQQQMTAEEAQAIESQQVAQYQSFITQQGDLLRDAYEMPYDAPEMRNVVTHLGEQEYFDSIRSAGKAYQKRMAKSGQPARPARSPGLGVDGGNAPRNPIANVENTSELYKMAATQARGNNNR
jgi:hypothetical protein